MIGIFVGGTSRRMGGRPKGRLVVPGTDLTIVEHLVRLARRVGRIPCLLGDASAYEDLVPDVSGLEDQPPGAGPLGGLRALLEHAGKGDAIALACDMPFVSQAAIEQLIAFAPDAAVVAAERGGRFEPFLARYDVPRVREPLARALEAGVRSCQEFMRSVDVVRLPETPEVSQALEDWDHLPDAAAWR